MASRIYSYKEALKYKSDLYSKYNIITRINGNKSYGNLTPMFKGKVGTTYALFCECDCGNIVFRKLASVISGRSPDCGCNRGSRADQKSYNKFLFKRSEVLSNYNITVYFDQWKSDTIPYFCPIHNEHLTIKKFNIKRGMPCGKCGKERASLRRTKTTAQFIIDATKVHGDMYDYSDTAYNGSHGNLKIFCNVSGNHFYPTATDHLSGCKCTCCFPNGGYNKLYKGRFYIIKSTLKSDINRAIIKFGIANRKTVARLDDYISRNDLWYHEILHETLFDDGSIPPTIEAKVKKTIACKVVTKDIFPDGHTETTDISNLSKILEIVKDFV